MKCKITSCAFYDCCDDPEDYNCEEKQDVPDISPYVHKAKRGEE